MTPRATEPERGRAAALLRVPADAAPADARAAFLRGLAADDFAPPEEAVAAANALTGAALPVSTDAVDAELARRRDDIEAFAAAYWSLPPDARRLRWAAQAVGADGPVAGRLADLAPGLDVTLSPHPNPLVEEVAAAVRAWSVLPPRDRAVRRAVWLADRADRVRDFADAARRLRADAPALAALAPDLARRLADPLVPVAPRTALTPGEQAQAEWEAYTPPGVVARPGEPRPQGPRETQTGWWVVYVVVAGLAVLIRGLSSVSSPAPPVAPAYPPPAFTPPVNPWLFPTGADATVIKGYTPAQRAAFAEYERTKVGPPPPGYVEYNAFQVQRGLGLRPGVPFGKQAFPTRVRP